MMANATHSCSWEGKASRSTIFDELLVKDADKRADEIGHINQVILTFAICSMSHKLALPQGLRRTLARVSRNWKKARTGHKLSKEDLSRRLAYVSVFSVIWIRFCGNTFELPVRECRSARFACLTVCRVERFYPQHREAGEHIRQGVGSTCGCAQSNGGGSLNSICVRSKRYAHSYFRVTDGISQGDTRLKHYACLQGETIYQKFRRTST